MDIFDNKNSIKKLSGILKLVEKCFLLLVLLFLLVKLIQTL
jgi:hypothetical protein